MRQRSELWRRIAARGRFREETVAVIGGVTYTAISAPEIEGSLCSDAMSVGNCNVSSMKIAILTDDVISKSAEVIIKARIIEGDMVSEWKEFGTFYIDKREKNHGLVTLQCFDSMLKASQRYGDPTDPDDRIGWPKSQKACVEEIAARIGVEIDPRTVINTEEQYQCQYPNDYTMLQVLGYIGGCHGGNWIITPENKLRLVPLVALMPETYDIIDEYYDKIYTVEGYKLVWKLGGAEVPESNSAGGHVSNVPVVIDKITTGKAMTISRVTIDIDDKQGYTEGDDTGVELRIDGNPYANRAICHDLYTAFAGLVYAPFSIQKACYDPCTELGDWMLVGDQVNSVLYSQSVTLGIDFRANASAPGKDEVSSEYPHLTEIEKLHKQDEKLLVYMDGAMKEVDSKILQTHTLIQLEVEARQTLGEYVTVVDSRVTIVEGSITSEVTRATNAEVELESRIKQTETSITTEVARAKGTENELLSTITQTAEKIEMKVSIGEISSRISVESGKVTIGANRLTIESDNFSLSGSGKVTASGTISTTDGTNETKVKSGGVYFYKDGYCTGCIVGDGRAIGGGGSSHVINIDADEDGLIIGTDTTYYFAFNNGLNTYDYYERLYLCSTRFDDDVSMNFQLYFQDYYGDDSVCVYGTNNQYGYPYFNVDCGLNVTGDIYCNGSKHRVVETNNYGHVGMNAVESTVAIFSDIGSGTIDENGVAYIYLDPCFIETIDQRHDYQVFTSQCSKQSTSYVVKEQDHFKVYGEPGAEFDWVVYCRQRDYADDRMETIEVQKSTRIRYDDSVFYKDNHGANQSKSHMAEFGDKIDELADEYLNNYELEVTGYEN